MAIDSTQLPLHWSAAVETLRRDHQIIARLLIALACATTPEERRDALTYLNAALVVHNATKDLVYPALQMLSEKKAGSERFYHNSAEVDALILELSATLQDATDSQFYAKVRALQAIVGARNAAEERSVIPLREFRTSFQSDPSP